MSSPSASARRASYLVSVAVFISRVLGLAREIVFTHLFGGSRAYDCFIAAFRAPNLLRDLFAEGALSTAFVTTFSKTQESDGEEAAWALGRKVVTLTAAFMTLVSLAGMFFSAQIMAVMTSGFSPADQAFAARLALIMFPFILMVSLAALSMGMLNARRVFFLPALASCFFNLGSVVAGVALAWWIDPSFGPQALAGMAGGVLVGGLLQWLVQAPALRRPGFRFRPDFRWRHPGVRKVLGLMGPAVIAGSAVQINVLVNTSFASYLAEGSMVWLNTAFRLMMFPLGVFGVAVGTVALPELARLAAQGKQAEFGARIGDGLRLVFFLDIPSALGLIALADPVVSLIYEHGRFGAYDRSMAAVALQAYSLGLLGYSALKILAPAFYAIDRRNLPMFVSLGSVVLNAGLNAWLIFGCGFDHRALAASTAVVATVNFLALHLLLRRAVGSLGDKRMLGELARVMPAGLAMAAACYGLWHLSSGWFLGAGRLWQAGWVTAAVGLGAAVYFGLCTLLRVEEARIVVAGVRRKLGLR